MEKKIGRPLGDDIIQIFMDLDEQKLYTPATIAKQVTRYPDEYGKLRKRIARWISYWAENETDGTLVVHGRAWPAYSGKTIKEKVDQYDINRFNKIPKPQVKNQRGFKKFKRIYLIALLSFGFLSASVIFAFLNNGHIAYQIYQTQGLSPAVEYISNLDKKSDYHAYLLAFHFVREKKFDESLKIEKMLRDKDPEKEMLGKIEYLRSYIEMELGNFELSLKHLDVCEKLYIFLSLDERMGDVYYLKGLVEARRYNLDSSEKYLEKGLKFYKEFDDRSNMARTLKLQVGNYIRLIEFEKALETAQKALELTDPQQIEELGKTYVTLAYTYGLNGKIEKCWEYTLQASGLINLLGDDRLYRYNLLNYLLIALCDNRPTDFIERAILEYTQTVGGDFEIEFFLDFTKSQICL